VDSVFGPVRFLLPVCRLSWFLYTLNIYAHFSSHFSQQLWMTRIWYLVTSFIFVPHIVGSVFGPIRFLFPVCRLELIFIHIEHIPVCSYFVAFFSANIDGRNLIFRHKLHIGMPFCGKRFYDPSDSYFLFADLVGFYTHLTYMHIFRHIFLSNYWWQRSDIWSQASYRYPISWEAFLDSSDSYFLFADFVDFYTHWTYILYMPIFRFLLPVCRRAGVS
jgi:hypothetical protein